jgi:cation-transporting ATPase I
VRPSYAERVAALWLRPVAGTHAAITRFTAGAARVGLPSAAAATMVADSVKASAAPGLTRAIQAATATAMPLMTATARALTVPSAPLTRVAGTLAAPAVPLVSDALRAAGTVSAPIVPTLSRAAGIAHRVGTEAARAAATVSADLGERRTRRRVWSRPGRAHVEVRGLRRTGSARRNLSQDVLAALHSIRGVRWAQINAVTAQVLVDFDEDRVGIDDLLDTIEAVEQAHGTGSDTFDWADPEHPGDDGPLYAAQAVLAADLAGLALAVPGRFVPWLRLPAAIRAPLIAVEARPRARNAIMRRFGPSGGHLMLASANAFANGASRGAATLAVDCVAHALLVGERAARRAAWARTEPVLCSADRRLPADPPAHRRRPVPVPPGPVEDAGSTISLAALGGAGTMLAWTRDPGRAAALIVATAPKAAWAGREGFATTLGIELARGGVLPLEPSALRLLDRVNAVVIDASVLCGSRPRILRALGGDGTASGGAQAWQVAGRILAAHSLDEMAGPGPWWWHGARLSRVAGWPGEGNRPRGVPDGSAPGGDVAGSSGLAVDLSDHLGRRQGRFLVGCDLHLHAEALLGAARESAEQVLLSAHASTMDLVVWADEILSGPGSLAPQIRRLQRSGHVVLAICAADAQALAAADVGVAVHAPDGNVCWSGDVICQPGLTDAWRLLRAVPYARRASERAARLSVGGSALGALVVATGQGPGRTRLGIAPVQSAALVGIAAGAVSARKVARAPSPAPVPRGDWHAMTARDVLERLGTYATPAPAIPPPAAVDGSPAHWSRQAMDSVAGLPPVRSAAQLAGAVRRELADPLTPVLALGTMASAVVGSSVDAGLVASVMVGNALIGGAQRMRVERSLGRLLMREQISARRIHWHWTGDPGHARLTGHSVVGVPRPPNERTGNGTHSPAGSAAGGRRRLIGTGDLGTSSADDDTFPGLGSAPEERIPASALVPGDIVALAGGDVVPADGRLLLADDLEVDESPLTGESLPVAKDTDPAPGVSLSERTCMVYEGSTILAGHGYAVVTATGSATEAGRAALAAGRGAPQTGIQARLAELTRISVPASGFGGLAVAGLGLLRGVPLRDAIASGVAVAVAAVPEGLPLVATVAQLAAARRLSSTGVLARSSRALEALGRVDTICFDKTGTLTQGRLTVTEVAAPDGPVAFSSRHGRHLLQVAARSSPPPGGPGRRGPPHATDRAVTESARERAGVDRAWHPAQELAFEASRGYSAMLGRNGGRTTLAVKGAPEVVLPRCAAVADRAQVRAEPMTADRRRVAEAVVEDLAAQGLRVLAVAETMLPGEPGHYHLTRMGNGAVPTGNGATGAARGHGDAGGSPGTRDGLRGGRVDGANGRRDSPDEIVTGLTLTGFVAIADTVRPTARAAVQRLADARVRVIMITGDHPATARAIAHDLGIPQAHRVLTGADLSSMPETARAAAIGAATVFARVSPEQKVRVIESLQRSGHVVAMAGDGVNDAAAIRLADVGIGVAARGSTSARSAADLILSGSDPLSILDALVEGRALWARVKEAVSILVGGNAGEVAFTLLGTAITGRAPLSTRQLLLVNMLTDMLPALAVALGPARATRNGDSPLISAGPMGRFLAPDLSRSLAVRGGATALGATVAWQAGRMTGRRRRSSTMALTTLVLTQLGQTLLTEGGRSPLTISTSVLSAGALAVMVETPGVSQFFGCTPLGPAAWSMVGGSAGVATLAAALAPQLLRPGSAGGDDESGRQAAATPAPE